MDRGKYYGDGCFESVLILNGKIPLLEFHYQRLIKTLHFLQLNLPDVLATPHALEDYILQQNSYSNNVVRCRLDVWREGSGKYLPLDDITVTGLSFEKIRDPFDQIKPGIRAGLSTYQLCSNIFSKYKTIARLPQVLMAKQASENGWDEAVVLNTGSEIAELISSNIFLITENGEIHTPPLDSGCLAGVLRQFLIDNFSLAFKISEFTIPFSSLNLYTGAFATNAVQGIIPVNNLAGRDMEVKVVAPIFEAVKKVISG